MNSTRGAGPGSRGADAPANLPRRTGTGHLLQVNTEVFFREVGFVGESRHSGNQGASRIGEGLPGIAVPVGGIVQGLLHQHTGIGLTPFHQFQGPQVVRSVAGQHLHGRDQLGVGVHQNRRFVPIKALAAALVAVAHLGVMHRHIRSLLTPSFGPIPSPVRSTS